MSTKRIYSYNNLCITTNLTQKPNPPSQSLLTNKEGLQRGALFYTEEVASEALIPFSAACIATAAACWKSAIACIVAPGCMAGKGSVEGLGWITQAAGEAVASFEAGASGEASNFRVTLFP